MKRIFFVALALVFLASGCILKREKPSNELLSALNIPAQACDAEDAEIGDERILGKWLVENRVAQSSGYESVDDTVSTAGAVACAYFRHALCICEYRLHFRPPNIFLVFSTISRKKCCEQCYPITFDGFFPAPARQPKDPRHGKE